MKQYPVKSKRFRNHRETRCVNPHCGKWVELKREKICPKCGKRSVERADKKRCDECGALLRNGDTVCPLCASKQRTIVEMRAISSDNLTAFAHLLHEAQPGMSLAECRKQCQSITEEDPYRLLFAGRPDRIQPFLRNWNSLGGTAAACLERETSRRPIVLLRSYNRWHEKEHARLLFEAVQKSDRPWLTFGETVCILHGINGAEEPVRLCFTSDFDRIEAWVDAWRNLGGTAVRSREHRVIEKSDDSSRFYPADDFAFFFP
jgi:RNA polymerase subunit RPABC4/transcription elongation factor Spt4